MKRRAVILGVNLHLVVIVDFVGVWVDKFEKYRAHFAAAHHQQVFVEKMRKISPLIENIDR